MSRGLKEAQNTSTSLLSEFLEPTDLGTEKEAPKVSNCVMQDSCQQRSNS